jgi:Uma2 family endonuclease
VDERNAVDRMMPMTAIRHVRPVRPVDFPSASAEWDVPEGLRHGLLCTLLYQVLAHAFRGRHSIGCDQFVYYDAGQPRRCIAPDVFVKLGGPSDLFPSWKTWERGAPELCVEILSPSDTVEKLSSDEKLRRYRALGTTELVAFDIDAPIGSRLRVWDRIDGDLVERIVTDETTPCLALSLIWVLAPGGDELPVALRLAERDPSSLLLTQAESALAEIDRLRKLLAERDR